MYANRAVSTTVGATLTVAIVVGLAAVVFFLTTSLLKTENPSAAAVRLSEPSGEPTTATLVSTSPTTDTVELRADGTTIYTWDADETGKTITLGGIDAGDQFQVVSVSNGDKQLSHTLEAETASLPSLSAPTVNPSAGSPTLSPVSYTYRCYSDSACPSTTTASSGTSFSLFKAPNTAPLDKYTNTMTLENTGSSDGTVSITTVAVSSDENGILTGTPEGTYDSTPNDGELDEAIKFKMWYNEGGTKNYVLGSSSSYVYADDVSSTGISDVPVDSGETETLYVKWKNDPSPLSDSNVIQSDKMTFDVQVQMN